MRERTPLTRDILERLPRLRLIVIDRSAGELVDRRRGGRTSAGSHVSVIPGYSSHERNSELTWALILAAVRHVPDEVASFRAGGWQVAVGTISRGARSGSSGWAASVRWWRASRARSAWTRSPGAPT